MEWKTTIEYIAAQFDELEQDAKNIIEVMTQFWGNIVNDEKLEQLTTQLQEAKNQLATLKKSLRTMLPIVSITWSAKLKELHQQVVKAQERQQKRSDQLDEFQEIEA